MSDTSQGPGWWQASDGKWYSPEQRPGYQPPDTATTVAPTPPSPVGADGPMGPGWWQATDGRWYPPQPGASYVTPQKKPVYKRVWFWLLMVLAVIVALIIILVAAIGTAVHVADTTKHTIVYSVTGTGTATITYYSFDNNHNGSAQLSDVPLPWTKTVVGSGIFNSYSVTGTLGESGGTVTCSLSVDGKQVSHNTATGAFSSANCTGNT